MFVVCFVIGFDEKFFLLGSGEMIVCFFIWRYIRKLMIVIVNNGMMNLMMVVVVVKMKW